MARRLEPELEPPRNPEALLLALDSSMSDPQTFNRLKDIAFRLARTRVIYAAGKDDLLGIIQVGSECTDNALAQQTPGGYLNIQQHMTLVNASVSSLRVIDTIEHGTKDANLLDLLDVSGDRLVSSAAMRARGRRLIIFTSSCSKMVSNVDGDQGNDDDDFIAVCRLYRQNNFQVDIILLCGNDSEQENDDMRAHIGNFDDSLEADDNGDRLDQEQIEQEDEEDAQTAELKGPHPKICIEKAKGFPCSKLLALSKSTGGEMMVYLDAFELTDQSQPRSKRANAKFAGLLDIAGVLQIPVKRYTYTSEVKPPSGSKVSWDEAKKHGKAIKVITDTNFVKAVKDDRPLDPEEIINAYHYGPNLVPIPQSDVSEEDGIGDNELEDHMKWNVHLPRGLHVIGFVKLKSTPEKLFMDSIDVVLPMKDSEESVRLFTALVLTLRREKLGILARSVMPLRGGAPSLCYLWPNVEHDRETKLAKNYFFFATQLPMREDVKDFGFANIQDQLKDVPASAFDTMEQFISASLLPDLNEPKDQTEGPNDVDEEEELDPIETLDTAKIPNPNLHWFHLCVMHRVINGPECTDFPGSPDWHTKLLDPISYIAEDKFDQHQEAIKELTTSLAILPVRQRKKKSRRSHTAANANPESLAQFLPDVENENEDNGTDADEEDFNIDDDSDEEEEEEEEVVMDRIERRLSAPFKADAANISEMTDLQVSDVSDENPLEDFQNLVRNGQFRFASLSLQVVIRRIIRDKNDNETVMRCLQALRKACIEKDDHRIFNGFIKELILRCERKDQAGTHTASLFRHVGTAKKLEETLKLIPPNKPKNNDGEETPASQHDEEALKRYLGYLERVFNKIKNLSLEGKNDVSLSEVNNIAGT